MSVVVQNLTKVYGAQRAVDSISFSVEKGQILGFLGPNGAGKSTTMKILTCFIPQTSGSAKVCGFDVENQSLEVRKRIGYLPEHNPLYKDLYIREYLSFVAGLHHLPKAAARVEEMIHITGLAPEANKKISALSKGYRQRIGLAQALIHDPEVLILDEPTTGLDPNQLVEIRQLIQELGKNKTVIFSSHIMQEVQAVCDRVLIIDQGRIVADDTIEVITSQRGLQQKLIVSFEKAIDLALLKALKGVKQVRHLRDFSYQVYFLKEEDVSKAIFQLAVQQQNPILELVQESANVEDVFQQLTRKSS